MGREEYARVLIGEYQNSIDAKNRLIVPSKFRNELSGKCILTRGLDQCLIIYPMSTWEEQQKKLAELPRSDRNARAFIRYVYANAAECEVDKQGRLLIPQNLKEAAQIEKDLVTIGLLDRIEIWAKETYDSSENGAGLSAESLEAFSREFQV